MFFFVDPKTPHLPYLHDFYSATWTNGDEQSPTRTGPIQDAPRRWRNGSFDIAPLPNIPIGTAAEFRDGLTYPADVNTEVMRAGISSACWTRYGLPFLPLDVVSNLNSCCIRTAYFQIIALLYAADAQRISEFFAEFLGPAAAVTFYGEDDTDPAMCIVTVNGYAMIFVSGTTNFQQWALQGAGGLVPPQNFGNVSTSPIWFQLGQLINARVTALGISGDTPLVIAGHSYGAAGSAVFAVRAKIANPARKIFLLTAGMPKTFDAAGRDHLERLIGFHVINAGDVVPQVPLSPEQSSWFGPVITAGMTIAMSQWMTVAQWSYQTADGRKQAIPLPTLTFDVLLPFMTQLLFAPEVSAIVSHTIDRYVLWSCRGCGCPRWPFTSDAWDILFPMKCDPAVFKLNDVMPAAGALKFSDRPTMESLVLESAVVPPAGDLVLEHRLAPAAGRLVLEDMTPAGGVLVLAVEPVGVIKLDSVLPASGVLRLGIEDVVPGSCPCCPGSVAPYSLLLQFSAPGYWFHGLNVAVEKIDMGSECFWEGEYFGIGNYLYVTVLSSDDSGEGVVWFHFSAAGTDGDFSENPATQWASDSFSCSPSYNGEGTTEIYDAGAPTGDFVTLTIL